MSLREEIIAAIDGAKNVPPVVSSSEIWKVMVDPRDAADRVLAIPEIANALSFLETMRAHRDCDFYIDASGMLVGVQRIGDLKPKTTYALDPSSPNGVREVGDEPPESGIPDAWLLDPSSTDARNMLSERDRKLDAIADAISYWVKWEVQKHRKVTPETHVWLNGYKGAPPHWPSVGQLMRWIAVLRGVPVPDESAPGTKKDARA